LQNINTVSIGHTVNTIPAFYSAWRVIEAREFVFNCMYICIFGNRYHFAITKSFYQKEVSMEEGIKKDIFKLVEDTRDVIVCSIYFLDSANIHGLMLTGRMKVYMDAETKLAFWRPGDEMYYSLGPEDPDYCMVCFTAEEGNYWGQQKVLFQVDSLKQ